MRITDLHAEDVVLEELVSMEELLGDMDISDPELIESNYHTKEAEFIAALEEYNDYVFKTDKLHYIHDIITTKGVNRETMYALEELVPGAVPEYVEILTFTTDFSDVNKDYALESIGQGFTIVFKLLKRFIRLLTTALLALLSVLVARWIVTGKPIISKERMDDFKRSANNAKDSVYETASNIKDKMASVFNTKAHKHNVVEPKIIAKYKTNVDRLIIQRVSGYTMEDVAETLLAHIVIINRMYKYLQEEMTLLKRTIDLNNGPAQIMTDIVDLKHTFIKDDFHLIGYTYTPIYKVVKDCSGFPPYSSATLKLHTQNIEFNAAPGDKFWSPNCEYTNNNGKQAEWLHASKLYSLVENENAITLSDISQLPLVDQDKYINRLKDIKDTANKLEADARLISKEGDDLFDKYQRLQEREAKTFKAQHDEPSKRDNATVVWPAVNFGDPVTHTDTTLYQVRTIGILVSGSTIIQKRMTALQKVHASLLDVVDVGNRIISMSKDRAAVLS